MRRALRWLFVGPIAVGCGAPDRDATRAPATTPTTPTTPTPPTPTPTPTPTTPTPTPTPTPPTAPTATMMTRTGDASAGSTVDAGVATTSLDANPGPSASVAPARPDLAVLHALAGIDIVESHNSARHMHGGSPASIGSASISFRVRDQRSHVIEARRLALLRGHCRETTWHAAEVLAVVDHEVHDWDSADPIARDPKRVTLPSKPDLYAVTLRFAPTSAYQACDRFAFAIELVVDGKPVKLELPLAVKRYEPLRRP